MPFTSTVSRLSFPVSCLWRSLFPRHQTKSENKREIEEGKSWLMKGMMMAMMRGKEKDNGGTKTVKKNANGGKRRK